MGSPATGPAWERSLALALGLGLVVRLAALFGYLATHGWRPETWEYEELARNLLAGEGYSIMYHNTEYLTLVVPVYPLICAGLHLIGGPGFVLYYVFHLSVALGIIWLTYAVAQRWLGPSTAGPAALLVAVEPGQVIYQSYKVDLVALSTLLILLTIHLFLTLTRSRSLGLAGLVGAVIGIGVLTRPDLAALFGMVAVWAVVERQRLGTVLKPAAALVAVCVLVLSPWLIRNYVQYGEMLFLTSFSSEAFWRGNNPNSTGTSVTMSNEGQLEAAPEAFRAKVQSSTEFEIYRLFQEEAIRFIKEDPAAFVERAVRKFFYFWWFTPNYATQHYGWLPGFLVRGYKLVYFALALLMLAGVRAIMRSGERASRQTTWILLSVPVMVAIIHSLNYVEGRHRVLVMPILLMFAAVGLAKLRELPVLGVASRPTERQV